MSTNRGFSADTHFANRSRTPPSLNGSSDHRKDQSKSPSYPERMFYVVSVNRKPTKEDESYYPGDYNRNTLGQRPTEIQDVIAETGSVTFEPSPEHFYNTKSKTKKSRKILAVVFIVLFLSLFIALILAFIPSKATKSSNIKAELTKACKLSTEYQKCGLGIFLEKFRIEYYRLQPQMIAIKEGVTADEVRENFRPFDLKPSEIKRVTDETLDLFQEFRFVVSKCPETALRVRERRAIDEAKYMLKYIWTRPYGGNYYYGDWLLSPNIYCWHPVCHAGYYLMYAMYHMKPKSKDHLMKLKAVLQLQGSAIMQYKNNVKLGVKTGMVRSQVACKAGLYSFLNWYPNVALYGQTGILKSSLGKILLNTKYISNLSNMVASDWLEENNKNVTMSLREYLIEYVGKPLDELIKYLKLEHMYHCLPESVSNGLATLPVSYVYNNGIADINQPTTKKLPTGEALNGSKTYAEYIFPFFTSNNITIEKTLDLAYSHLAIMYNESVDIAKQETGESNEAEAVKKFRERLNLREMFYNEKPFPKEESDEKAFLKCRENTSFSCPERMRAMSTWINASTKAAKMYQSKWSEVFYTEPGPKKTTPNCSVTRGSGFEAFRSYHSYGEGHKNCSLPPAHFFPFFLDDYGPVYDLHTHTIHEVALGHHVEVQGFKENFQENCTDPISWLNTVSFVSPFTEGWASYSEFQIGAKDLDVMIKDPMQKYGIVRRQIILALRCIIDIGFHYNGLNTKDALDLLDKWAWVTGDFARKEITRYQSSQGATITYFVGQTAFLEARKYAEEKLGSSFSVRELHYRMLHLGDTSLQHMKSYVERYVDCVMGDTTEGCYELIGEEKNP